MRGFDFAKYKRIILIGSPGSGKSWLSKRIAEITGFPLYHLDKEYWQPDWVLLPRAERIVREQEFISGEKWIIDGNYNGTMELRFAPADLVIFLDISRLICLLGAAGRTGKKRSDLPDYLKEPPIFNGEFLKFCKYIWEFPKTDRNTIINLREKYPEKEFLHIKSRREVRNLIK